jgi:Ni/Fe-hydrogenase subunit HybB-like protein
MKSRPDMLEEALRHGRRSGRKTWIAVFGMLALIGSGAFLFGITGPMASRAWQAYLINFLFWSGLAFGTVLFSAMLTLTHARWGRPLKRLAEAPGAFLPVAFLLFWVLFFGRETIFPWIHESVGHKKVWLSSAFLFARDGASLLLLTVVSVALVSYSVRRDIRFLAVSEGGGIIDVSGKEQAADPQTVLAPVLGILYAVVLSLIGFDLVMSLSPHWHSTLFGAYYFVGCFYSGLAGLAVLSYFAARNMRLEGFIENKHFHDLGKLLLAFCMVAGDFFYSQFLVIWYGNLPNETRYVLLRVRESPWDLLAWAVLFICFAIPFCLLLSRKFKRKPALMMILGITILVGMWLERFLLVVPSIWKGGTIPLGLMELLITAGFFGIVALCVFLFLQKFPVLPVSDPLFREGL